MDFFKKLKEWTGYALFFNKQKGLSYRRVFKDAFIKDCFLEHRRQMARYNQSFHSNVEGIDKTSFNYWNRI